MCGIVGYIGNSEAKKNILNGLRRLEYRGYDSSGLSTFEENSIVTSKCKGKISELELKVENREHKGNIGIGHTRWATHGKPNQINAHPHHDYSNKFSLVHNGIIENHYTIKKFLKEKGVNCISDTDTEVLVQFISYLYHSEKLKFYDAVKLALKEVVGAYGIVIMCHDEPDKIIAARNGSPLVVGLGQKENYVASDTSAIIDYTRNILFLEDGEIIELEKTSYKIKHIDHDEVINKEIKKIEYSLDAIEKGKYEHFMLKEIFQQPLSMFIIAKLLAVFSMVVFNILVIFNEKQGGVSAH